MRALFEIGQKVVCVDSREAEELIEGKTYVVSGFDQCNNCNGVGLFVGIKTSFTPYPICGACGSFVPKKTQISFRQTRFVPLEFDKQADEEIHNALKESLKVKI